MITVGQISEILSLYKQHGWILRRVLLSDELRVHLTDDLFGDVEIVSALIDALWFSRTSKAGEAWEIRHLSQTPFALVEVFPTGTDAEEREEIIKSFEMQLFKRINTRHSP